jgi:hypothetical protein
MRIPLAREIGEGMAQGKLLIEIRPEFREQFRQLFTSIEKLAGGEAIRR